MPWTISASLLDPKIQIPDNTSLDDSTRVAYVNSFWKKIGHLQEKKQLDSKVQQEVKSFFQQRYGYQDATAFDRVWKRVGAKKWTPSSELTVGKFRDIDQAFQQQLVYHGQGMQAPPTEMKTGIDSNVQKFVQTLLHGRDFPKELIHQKEVRNAVFIKKDHELLKQFRAEMQKELDNLAKNPPKTAQEEILWRAFLGNILALIPFSYPTNQDTLTIPMLSEGKCIQVSYSIEVLPLKFNALSSPMIALGMMPKNNDKAPPMLCYLGTTYPAGDGFAATVFADFTPGYSVGDFVYSRSKDKIDAWMKDKKDVHVIGTSLGGALTFHTLRHHEDKLSRVDVYNPPGLYNSDWVAGVGDKCPTKIYCQPGDLVSKMGAWPTGKNVSLYAVVPHQENLKENLISSHARAFTGCPEVSIIKQDPQVQNKGFRRRFLTFLHRFLGPVFVFVPSISVLLIIRAVQSIRDAAARVFHKKKNDESNV